ncbi:MAG: lysylphosphatidylglycerol synthase domain-containing protein, partial [Janthinobacterium lividum]
PWALLVLVVVGSSAVTAAVPIPGGIGASEASLVAGLVAAGVEPSAALSAALLHRFLTFWVRVPAAWVALLLLRRRSIV